MKKSTIILSACTVALSACGTPSINTDTEQQNIIHTVPEAQGDVPNYGEEQSFAYGAIGGVGDALANGVAQSHMYKDGHFVHTLTVNIEVAPDGYFYEGWIVNGSDVISTGNLSNAFGDTRYALQFESDIDLTEYTKVIVTLEKDDGNPAPDIHVAEGNLHAIEPRRS